MYLLTEFVRLLEQRGHIFPNDPHAATENLRHTQGDIIHKLHQRAQIIDRDHILRQTLQHHQQRWQMLGRVAWVMWFAFGFASTYALMKHTQLNFFLILLGVLGMNTVMLLIWFANTLLGKPRKPQWLPLIFNRQNTPYHAALAQLYSEYAMQPRNIWRRNAYSHQLALCALGGMWLAALFLLTVRQYSFNWESTLLSSQTFAQTVNALAWLPEKIGFATPHGEAIAAGRNSHDTAHAASWGSLLLGSMICYGIVPRLLAWGFCAWQRPALELDVQLAYYQNIIQKWQRQITDSDHDYRPDPIVAAPVVTAAPPSSQCEYWAVLLDAPHSNPNWYAHLLGQDWRDCGVIAERDEIAAFHSKLSQQATQLLVGVRAHIAPDRGQIRTLGKLASQAQHGMVVKLLPPHDAAMLAQWHEILRQNGWAWVE